MENSTLKVIGKEDVIHISGGKPSALKVIGGALFGGITGGFVGFMTGGPAGALAGAGYGAYMGAAGSMVKEGAEATVEILHPDLCRNR